MTYTTPATPVSGTAITVPFYATNIRDNIAHLRTILPDPGGATRVLVSSSTTAAAWTPTPQLTGQLKVSVSNTVTSAAYSTAPILVESSGGSNYAMIGFNRSGGGEAAALYFGGGNFNYVTNTGVVGTFWSNQNDGAGSGLDADVLDGMNAGNSSGQIPISNGTLNTNLNADMLDGHDSAYFALSGTYLPLGGGTLSGTLTAPEYAVSGLGNAGSTVYRMGAVNNGLWSSASNEIHFAGSGTDRGRVDDTGQLYWEYEISGSNIVDRSDERIKHNIRRDFRPDLGGLRTLPVARFAYRNDERQREHVGFVAQDVQAVAPWAVVDHAFQEDRPNELGISLPAMLAMLVLAYQEQALRLDALEQASS